MWQAPVLVLLALFLFGDAMLTATLSLLPFRRQKKIWIVVDPQVLLDPPSEHSALMYCSAGGNVIK